MKEQIVAFLNERCVISQKQRGFVKVKGLSRLTNLLEVFEHWTKSLDEGYGVDVIDYRKAFDIVPHQRLLTWAALP